MSTSFKPVFDEIEGLLARYKPEAHFSGPKDDALIDKAEAHLGVELPPSYREFLRRWGTLGFGPAELYGVIDDDFEKAGVPDGIWFTMTQRAHVGLPPSLVVVENGDDGDYYMCIDTSIADARGESPVVIWDVAARQVHAQRAGSFAEFLLMELRETADIIQEDD